MKESKYALASMLILLTSYGAYHICIATARLSVLEPIKSVIINIRIKYFNKFNHEIFLGPGNISILLRKLNKSTEEEKNTQRKLHTGIEYEISESCFQWALIICMGL